MIKIIIIDKDETAPLKELATAHLVVERNLDDKMKEYKIIKNRWGRTQVEYHEQDFLLLLKKEVLDGK